MKKTLKILGYICIICSVYAWTEVDWITHNITLSQLKYNFYLGVSGIFLLVTNEILNSIKK